MPALPQEFFVACLCAEWCGTCRDYRDGFNALREQFPDVAFRWVDVEDESDLINDPDVENFPTLLIQRGNAVLFYGVMLPQHGLLKRLIETYRDQTPDESAAYAHANGERQAWQATLNLRAALGFPWAS